MLNMSICPNCGSSKILWGRKNENSSYEINEVPQLVFTNFNQEEQERFLNDLNDNSIIMPLQTMQLDSTVQIRTEGSTLKIEGTGITIENGEKLMSLVICEDCGTVYNGKNNLESHEKVKKYRESKRSKITKYKFIQDEK